MTARERILARLRPQDRPVAEAVLRVTGRELVVGPPALLVSDLIDAAITQVRHGGRCNSLAALVAITSPAVPSEYGTAIWAGYGPPQEAS